VCRAMEPARRWPGEGMCRVRSHHPRRIRCSAHTWRWRLSAPDLCTARRRCGRCRPMCGSRRRPGTVRLSGVRSGCGDPGVPTSESASSGVVVPSFKASDRWPDCQPRRFLTVAHYGRIRNFDFTTARSAAECRKQGTANARHTPRIGGCPEGIPGWSVCSRIEPGPRAIMQRRPPWFAFTAPERV
jgi:hypothetical protein